MGKFIQTEQLVTANGEGKGFPGGAVVKNPPANAGDTRDMGLKKRGGGGGRHGFDFGVGEVP